MAYTYNIMSQKNDESDANLMDDVSLSLGSCIFIFFGVLRYMIDNPLLWELGNSNQETKQKWFHL